MRRGELLKTKYSRKEPLWGAREGQSMTPRVDFPFYPFPSIFDSFASLIPSNFLIYLFVEIEEILTPSLSLLSLNAVCINVAQPVAMVCPSIPSLVNPKTVWNMDCPRVFWYSNLNSIVNHISAVFFFLPCRGGGKISQPGDQDVWRRKLASLIRHKHYHLLRSREEGKEMKIEARYIKHTHDRKFVFPIQTKK